MQGDELNYKRLGRTLTYMLLLYLPLFCAVLFLAIKVVHSLVPVFIFGGLWMLIMLVLSVRRIQAYHKLRTRL